MWKTLLAGSVVIVGLALLPAENVFAQKKKEGKSQAKGNPAAEPADYKRIQNQKELVAKVGSTTGGSMTITLEFPHMEPNPNFKPQNFQGGANNNYYRQLLDLQRQQEIIARTADPFRRQQRMAELARDIQRIQFQQAQQAAKAVAKATKQVNNNNGPFKVVVDKKDMDLDFDEKVVVRWQQLPSVYDDKGNIKVYTKGELAELRGKDANVPGYAAKVEDLAPNQLVKLFLIPPKKDGKKVETVKKDADKEGGKEAKGKAPEDEGVGNVARPTIRMILILEEANNAVMFPKGK